MKKRTKFLAGCTAVVAAGTLVGPLGAAVAGHANTVLETTLSGRSEIGADGSRRAGDMNGRGEAYVFGIDDDPTTLCYVLTVERIEPATAAHIHKGRPGENGPVVANLGAPADGDAADCLTEGETNKFPTGETVRQILGNPGDYYVNVHNAEYPGGAVRGQLRAQ